LKGKKIQVAKWGTPKKIFKKEREGKQEIKQARKI